MRKVKQGGFAPALEEKNSLYFPERLKAKLSKAQAMRGIFIEAPVGYGKTTLAAKCLCGALPKETILAWHHCKKDTPQALWRNLCLALQTIDEKTATELLRLGCPDEYSLNNAARLFWGIQCAVPTWLVLDDFHNLARLAPSAVWNFLLEHECPHLCTVLISRPLHESPMPYANPGFLYLGADDLRLTQEESREYAAKAGAALSGEEAEQLHQRSEGWMFALFLHVRRYLEKNTFAPASDFEGLIRDEIWRKLNGACRDFLQRVSPFEAFSPVQASQLLHLPQPPAALIAQLANTAILRFDEVSGLYYPHSLLLEYTRKTINTLSKTAQREIFQAAADWYAASGELKKAIALYYQLENFESLLALDLSDLPDNRLLDLPDAAADLPDDMDAPTQANGGKLPAESYPDALRIIAANCSRVMKIRHPLSAIQLAFEFFGQGLHEEYAAMCGEIAAVVETDVPERERDYLRGELLLMEAFSRYNDIAEMGRRMQRASELTGGKTSLISPDNAWTFGNASVLFMYHRQAGRLDSELADMHRYCPHYAAMSKGHGSGGPALMRAEALLNRGDAENAEIFGHRARHEAAMRRQISISIGVEFFFGRLAILRGDGAAYSRALDFIASLAQDHPQKSNRMEADMARSFLALLLHCPQEAAAWLRDGPVDAFSRRLFTQAIPFAHVCRALCLLLARNPQVMLDENAAALSLACALHSTLARVYGHIHAAAAWAMLEEGKKAASELRQALDLALPDALYMPFAENYRLIGPLLTTALSGKQPKEELPRIKALAKQMKTGRESVCKEIFAKETLTERKLKIMRMAADGLTNQQIADALSISINTVKDHLKTINQKHGVQGRAARYQMLIKN
jgi:LuxR family maltose regulon positive regulatory protein